MLSRLQGVFVVPFFLILFHPGLISTSLGARHRYKDLKSRQDVAKRGRGAGEIAVKRDISSAQSETVSLLSATMPKKACLKGVGAGEGNALGFRAVERTHERLVPQQ